MLALVLGEPDNYLDFLFQGLAVDSPAEALTIIERTPPFSKWLR